MHTLEFLFSSIVPVLIWELVEFWPREFGDKVIPKVICDKSVALNNCSLFKIILFLGWLTRGVEKTCGLK